MVLAKGVYIGTLYKMDTCMAQCNNSFLESKKRGIYIWFLIWYQVVKSIAASSSDGYAFWVPKGSNAFEMKLLVEKTMLWHQRLGHITQKGLKNLKQQMPH